MENYLIRLATLGTWIPIYCQRTAKSVALGEASNYPLIELTAIRWLEIQKEPDTEVLIAAHALASDRKTNLFLSRNNEGFVAEISVDNTQKMSPRLCSSFTPSSLICTIADT